MELIFDKEYATIHYEQENNLMYLELIGNIATEQYKETFNTLTDMGADAKIKYLLVNQATMKNSSMEAKAWLITTWLPRTRKIFNDEVKTAILVSKNIFTKLGAEYVVAAVRKFTNFDMRTFVDQETARKWLFEDTKI